MLQSIQKNVTWRAIPFAGLAAGTVFLLTNIILMPIILDVDGALLLRYIAALGLGNSKLVDDSTSVLLVGIVIHYLFSLLFALVIAIVVHRWGLAVGIIGGAGLGLAIYGINLYSLTYFFDWFFAINSSVLLLGHVLFGAVAGGVYELFDHLDLPLFDGDGGVR